MTFTFEIAMLPLCPLNGMGLTPDTLALAVTLRLELALTGQFGDSAMAFNKYWVY